MDVLVLESCVVEKTVLTLVASGGTIVVVDKSVVVETEVLVGVGARTIDVELALRNFVVLTVRSICLRQEAQSGNAPWACSRRGRDRRLSCGTGAARRMQLACCAISRSGRASRHRRSQHDAEIQRWGWWA